LIACSTLGIAKNRRFKRAVKTNEPVITQKELLGRGDKISSSEGFFPPQFIAGSVSMNVPL
jgi:hypothetical protein